MFVLVSLLIGVAVFILLVFVLNSDREKGALQVTSDPGSVVYLNDKKIGNTPLKKDMIDVGEYTIKLVPSKGNFEPFQQKIKITPKILTVVDRIFAQTAFAQAYIITLEEIDDKNQAQISVATFPVEANVYLDSNLFGLSPALIKNVTDSDHEIKITKQGYKDKSIRIHSLLGYKLDVVAYLGVDANSLSDQTKASASATLTPAPSGKVTILNTPTGFLRVRDKASLGGKEITQVKPGEEYQLLDEQSGWYEIKIDDKTTGWISAQYAKKQ